MEADSAPRTLDVRGRRIVVTGAGAGIGLAIARTMMASGARVHVTDIDPEAIRSALRELPGLTATVADAASPGDADRMRQDVLAALGGIDVLIGNVGIAGPTGGIGSYADADGERAIGVNLTSHFYVLDRLVPLLKDSGRNPSIIAISSVAGRLGYALRTPYAATKWAIVGLVKSLAIELGPLGIRANAILPGIVEGPRMDRVIEARARAAGVGFEAMREEYLQKISLRRMVEAGDVADLALFLASDLARNISGQAISVDGNVEHL